MSRSPSTSRRGFLRGAGAAICLPALESMLPARPLWAGGVGSGTGLATTASGAPLRVAFLFFPNGSIPGAWWPERTGSDFELSPSLEPLADLKNSVQVLKGMDNRVAEAGRDGAGDHARGGGTFLTGVRVRKSASRVRAGISIDQVIAQQVGHLTRFPSLELASDPVRQTGNCDSGYSCAYQYNLSWQSPTTPMATEHNPRFVFERLFGSGPPAERARHLAERRARQKSLLDFALADARAMEQQLPAADRRKLDEYLTGVRQLEQRIERAEAGGRDPELEREVPVGIPASHPEYVDLMTELAALAFQTDSTRVLTLLLAHDGDNRSFKFLDIPEGHHELSHHQNKADWIAKLQKIDAWYVERYARFLKRLDSIEDVDGNSVLYNSMVLIGSGNADGNRHTHRDLPILLGGQGGGALQAGRFVDFGGQPLANLHLTLAQRMGLHSLASFGNSRGQLGDI